MTRILLTEDDEDVRELVQDSLLDEGYEVEATDTVAGALSLLGRGSYDLALTDGRLPDGNGLMVAEQATQRGIKVLIFTGYAHEFPADQLARYTVVLKPSSMTDLMDTVGRLIQG
ncbi:MAG TPA: response regulator [Stellaceae bacterium]|jgi:DNA-binding NtrC family response regulator|nr:response regulator [Stellaceae bacterium]